MAQVQLRFYEELNDFLPPERRKVTFTHELTRRTSVKDLIESFGVPHTEVEVILANGRSVDFSYIVQVGDRISVYPVFESLDISPLIRLRTNLCATCASSSMPISGNWHATCVCWASMSFTATTLPTAKWHRSRARTVASC
jgi:hypothetical protein